MQRRKTLGTYDSDEEAEKLKRKQEREEQGKAAQESEEEKEKIGLTTFKKPKVKAKIPIKKGNTLQKPLNLKEEEVGETVTRLKTVGPKLVTS